MSPVQPHLLVLAVLVWALAALVVLAVVAGGDVENDPGEESDPSPRPYR